MSPTQGERLSSLEQWARDHDRACEQRLADIKKVAGGTDAKIDKLQEWVIRLLLGVSAFSLITLLGIVLHALKLA